MAKANTIAYLVTDKAISLSYNGKDVFPGDVASDFPGESISWLLSDGLISLAPTTDPTPPTDAPNTSAETMVTN